MDTSHPAPQKPRESDPAERGGDTTQDPNIERAVPRSAPEKR